MKKYRKFVLMAAGCGEVEGEQKEKLLLKKGEHFQFTLGTQNS